LATSTSNPLIVPSGFFRPSPGWSNLVPMTMVSPLSPPPPHAVAASGSATASASAPRTRFEMDGIGVPFD